MDNFQIYEEIGKGSSSVVYKGRKRKTIEYAAVKCIEKHHKQKVFNEVSVVGLEYEYKIAMFLRQRC